MVTETRTKLTGQLATLGQSFPGADLVYPMVTNQRVKAGSKDIYGQLVAYLLPLCYPPLQNGSRREKTGSKARS